MKKITTSLLLLFTFQFVASAVEGMWIPSLIEMFHSDMKTYGLKLSAEEIYATNQTSLKDAIVQFNGGCTAEIVSDKSLLLTNHHCGLYAIQMHSSVEKDYLKDGFWSKNHSEELSCPWLKVTFVKEIRDVTKEILSGDPAELSNRIKALELLHSSGTMMAKIKPFNLGNQYYMLITEDFNDIRLVGAPPSSIGSFGGDTDNWIWPRHTGDFSVFRIYADKENKSAKYDVNNVPYTPNKSLPISLKPKNVGDFTMVYGFPGTTDQHYVSGKLKFYVDHVRPSQILMRQKTLDLMKPAMEGSDEIRIQYASKQARIANAWKKWIGQLGGLKELKSIDKKKAFEEEYMARAAESTEWKAKYYKVVNELNQLQAQNEKYELADALFIEYFFVGPEFMNFTFDFYNLATNYDDLDSAGTLQKEIDRLKTKTDGFYKNYNKELDHAIFNALTPIYLQRVDQSLLPAISTEDWQNTGNLIFEKSLFLNVEKLKAALTDCSKKTAKTMLKDPAFKYVMEVYRAYLFKVSAEYDAFEAKEKELMKIYVEGMMEMFPDKKSWPDANSTLRIAYGKVDGSSPYDGMQYNHFTTIDGIMQKYDPSNPDFQLTDRFIELYNQRNFGKYTQDGELWVCFTASNHTTGGNSGSPVIDAEGNLMGINFDRSWESTMSDFQFDESRCRNIVVDIRYVLWVIEVYGGAKHLIDEMKFVN
jgi:hypothetical protein